MIMSTSIHKFRHPGVRLFISWMRTEQVKLPSKLGGIIRPDLFVGFLVTTLVAIVITAARDDDLFTARIALKDSFAYLKEYCKKIGPFLCKCFNVIGVIKPLFCILISMAIYFTLFVITNDVIVSITGAVTILLDESFLSEIGGTWDQMALFCAIVIVIGIMLSLDQMFAVTAVSCAAFAVAVTISIASCFMFGSTVPLLICLITVVGFPVKLNCWDQLLTYVNMAIVWVLVLVIQFYGIAGMQKWKYADWPYTAMDPKSFFGPLYIIIGGFALAYSLVCEKKEFSSPHKFIILALVILYTGLFPVEQVGEQLGDIARQRVAQMKMIVHIMTFVRLGYIKAEKKLRYGLASGVVVCLLANRILVI